MGKREYGADFLYEQYGRMAMENAMLKEELAYAQTAIKELEKDADKVSADMKELDKLRAEKKDREDWVQIVNWKNDKIKDLESTIEALEEQLAEKDQMIAGFNHEHARERAEEERDEF